MALEHGQYKVNDLVTITETGDEGRILVIGINARHGDGESFTIFGILVGSSLQFKRPEEVCVR